MSTLASQQDQMIRDVIEFHKNPPKGHACALCPNPPAPGHRTLHDILRDACKASGQGEIARLYSEYAAAAAALFGCILRPHTSGTACPRCGQSPLSERLDGLSQHGSDDATRCSQRGDNEGSFYARGLRDAYATAAMMARKEER
jgi:hypothetical protein